MPKAYVWRVHDGDCVREYNSVRKLTAAEKISRSQVYYRPTSSRMRPAVKGRTFSKHLKANGEPMTTKPKPKGTQIVVASDE